MIFVSVEGLRVCLDVAAINLQWGGFVKFI